MFVSENSFKQKIIFDREPNGEEWDLSEDSKDVSFLSSKAQTECAICGPLND